MKALSVQSMAVVASLPVAGTAGRYAFQTSNATAYFDNGTAWVAIGPGTAPAVFTPINANQQVGSVWSAQEFSGGGVGGTNDLAAGGTSAYVAPLSSSTLFPGIYPSALFTSTAAAYSIAGGLGPPIVKVGNSSYGGFVLTADIAFPVAPAGSSGFIGLIDNLANVYGNVIGSTCNAIGIGWSSTDTSSALSIVQTVGTTAVGTPYNRGGTNTGVRFVRMVLSVPPGATVGTLDVWDETLQQHSIVSQSIPITLSTTALLSAAFVSCTVAGTSAITASLYHLSCVPYPTLSAYPLAAANITGNAATATALATGININGTVLNAGGSLTIGSTSTARSSVAVPFATGNQDSFQRVTVSNGSVTTTTPPWGFTAVTGSTSEGADLDISYTFTLESFATGTFTFQVQAHDVDGDSLDGIPLPDITVFYSI